MSHFKHFQSNYDYAVGTFIVKSNLINFSLDNTVVVNFLNLPVYKRRDISRRGLSWAVSRAERSPEPTRTVAFYPLIKTFCLAVCRGRLPPEHLAVSRGVTAERILLPSPRRFDWSSHRNLHNPLWSRRACCGLSSPSPERTGDGGRLSRSPCRRSPLCFACLVSPLLPSRVGESIVRLAHCAPGPSLVCRSSK